jgi:hypothetical protein
MLGHKAAIQQRKRTLLQIIDVLDAMLLHN